MGDWLILFAGLAGVIGGILSRWIPLSKNRPPNVESSTHSYEVRRGKKRFYKGGDLHKAKVFRDDNPDSVLVVDGVSRG